MKGQLRKSKNSEGKKIEGKKSKRANLGSIEQKCCYRQSTRIKGSEEKAAALCAAKTQFQAGRDSLESAKTTPSNNSHCEKCS